MIPTFQRPDLLRESLTSALAQITSLAFEVVVIDNGSEPEMSAEVDKVIASFDTSNLRLFRNQTNIGMFGNWNRCIELARGEWLSILNDDDLLKTNFIDTIWKAKQGTAMVAANFEHFGQSLQSHPAIELFKPLYFYLRDVWRFRKGFHRVILSDVLRTHPMQGSLGVLMNKAVAVRLGGYNESCWPSSDYVFTVRYWIEDDVILLPNKLAAYRWQENASLNTKTLEGWLPKNFLMRNELIEFLPCNSIQKSLLMYLSRLQARSDAFISRTRVNAEFDSVNALRKIGITNVEHFYLIAISPLMRVLWRVLIMNLDFRKVRESIILHIRTKHDQ
jgi:glycosyltransferase involved in cell wall biosynthesis